MSSFANLKFDANFRLSSSPQKMVNSPPNGFFRKSTSNEAMRSCLLFFQYAYAIVIWYASVRSAVARLLTHGDSFRKWWWWFFSPPPHVLLLLLSSLLAPALVVVVVVVVVSIIVVVGRLLEANFFLPFFFFLSFEREKRMAKL